MPEKVLPARPHTGLTDDGRQLSVLTTYTRRGSRLTASQAAAWEAYADRWHLPDATADAGPLDLAAVFGREAPLLVEIGSGTGEATVATATARPDVDVLAVEVWKPGVAQTLARLGAAGATNVRTFSVDAVWSLEHLLGPASVTELHTFFPDPWPKKRHHRRRLVLPSFARLVASRLVPGGVWRLATDWPDYAEQIVEVLAAESALSGGVVPRFEGRPLTKFERRGIAEGRPITDVAVVRV